MKILLVEDDLATQKLLAEVLTARNYQMEVAGDGKSALELARKFDYDLMLLDINIPKLDGLSVCKLLRMEGSQLPILLLTAKDEISDRIIGWDAGADDYAIKPFSVPELLARIRALLRRGQIAKIVAPPEKRAQILSWERLQLNCITNEVRYADRVLHLTPKEYGILKLLISNPQRIFSRSSLIARLWELAGTPTESVVNSHIKSIRQKLKTARATHDPIETVYGFGYRLRQLESQEIGIADLPSQSEDLTTPTEVADALMMDLWIQFKDSFAEQIDLLIATATAYADRQIANEHHANNAERHPIEDIAQSARQVAHKLVGSLGVYGFPNGSILARQIEDLLSPSLDLTATDIQELTQLIADLQQELSREPVFGNNLVSPVQPLKSLLIEPPEIATNTREYRVMAVDDDPAILQQLSSVLTPWGLQLTPLVIQSVPLVENHRCFWEQLNKVAPDLLILDVEMPGLSGIELCKSVRNDSRWGDLPILFITAAQDSNTIIQAFAAGGDDYIRKPILVPELIARTLNQLEPRNSTIGSLHILERR
jgi:DNA-binding response OmpR family regulator